MNIPEIASKIKALVPGGGEWLVPAMVLLVGLASFGLGRLSAIEEAWPSVLLRRAETAPRPLPLGGEVVASRSGSVYYFPWCGGVSAIKPENMRSFKDEEAARAAGYRPAKNCKGLGAGGE